MAALRFILIFVALVGFFLIGVPLQWMVARCAPRLADRIPSVFCRSLLRLMRVDVAVRGDIVASAPVLVAANHVSWIDILVLGATAPFCFLAKSDVASWPVVSAFASAQGTVFVDRRRRRTIPEANRRMASRMLQGRPVLLFPEGTTVAGPEPGPFRSSHFAAARDVLVAATGHDVVLVIVQPSAIAYSSDSAAWIGDDDLLSHLWRTLCAPPIRCSITFGAPIAYTACSHRKQVAHQAREAVIGMLRALPAKAGSADRAMPSREFGEIATPTVRTRL